MHAACLHLAKSVWGAYRVKILVGQLFPSKCQQVKKCCYLGFFRRIKLKHFIWYWEYLVFWCSWLCLEREIMSYFVRELTIRILLLRRVFLRSSLTQISYYVLSYWGIDIYVSNISYIILRSIDRMNVYSMQNLKLITPHYSNC